MTNYSVKNVNEFISDAPPLARAHLRKIREVVKSAIPDAEEKIGYGKPYYKHNGWIAGFDAYKNHVGFEIWDGLEKKDREQLEKKGYKTGSTTFQIRYDQEVPTKEIQKLVTEQFERNKAKK